VFSVIRFVSQHHRKESFMPRLHSDYPLCRHTKTNGRRCQSPALTTSAFCRHHQRARRTGTSVSGPGHSTSVLYPLRNAESVQQALSMVFSGIATGQIHPRQAGKMLFALQTVNSTLRKPQ
jgi:hypothetical protein